MSVCVCVCVGGREQSDLVASRTPVVDAPMFGFSHALRVIDENALPLFRRKPFTGLDSFPRSRLVSVLQGAAENGVTAVERPHLGRPDNFFVAEEELDVLHFIFVSGLGEHSFA